MCVYAIKFNPYFAFKVRDMPRTCHYFDWVPFIRRQVYFQPLITDVALRDYDTTVLVNVEDVKQQIGNGASTSLYWRCNPFLVFKSTPVNWYTLQYIKDSNMDTTGIPIGNKCLHTDVIQPAFVFQVFLHVLFTAGVLIYLQIKEIQDKKQLKQAVVLQEENGSSQQQQQQQAQQEVNADDIENHYVE